MPVLKLLQTAVGHEERVWHVCWSPDGRNFASCSQDQTTRIWSISEASAFSTTTALTCVHVIDEGHSRTVRCCEWSPCSRYLATASFDGFVLVFAQAGQSWTQIASLEGHENEVKSISWSADGNFLATCGRDKKIWIWEKVDRNDFECAAVLDGHTQDVKFVKWHSDRSILYSCGYDDTIRIWTESDGDWYCAKTLVGHLSTVWALEILKEGQLLVTCSDDKSIMLWECDSASDFSKEWRKLSVLHGVHEQAIYSIHLDPETNLLATGSGDNSIALLSLAKGDDGMPILEVVAKLPNAHDLDVNCVRWRPRGPREENAGPQWLLSAGDDATIKLWQLEL